MPRKPDKEDKKNYFKMQNKKVIPVRFNAKERALIESMMREDGWENTSGFIKYKVFGLDPERKADELIKRKNPDDLTILLRNEVMDLTEYFIYFHSRYEKDMNQLWKEEGVDLKKWISSTNTWHAELAKRTEEVLTICRKIAKELKLDEYFELPSAQMEVKIGTSSKEELDQLAAQLRKERIAMGRTDVL